MNHRDKQLQLCARSIIRHINGDRELSEQYKKLALKVQFDSKCIYRIEELISEKSQIKLKNCIGE